MRNGVSFVRLLAVSIPLIALAGCSEESKQVIADPDLIPADGLLRRLTETQFQSSLAAVFGPEVPVPVSPEPDVQLGRFLSVGATQATFSPRGVEAIEKVSFDLAKKAMANEAVRARLVPCAPAATRDDACATTALTKLGEQLWRRPVTAEESSKFVELSGVAATTLGDFYAGLEYGIAGIIQSPNFLFRVELGENEGSAAASPRLNDFELATRLSYFFWNTSPDDALLAAAEQGLLSTDAGLLAQAERLFADPRVHGGVRNFFNEYFQLYELDKLDKDPTIFEHARPELGPIAREETLSTIEALLLEEEGDYRELFTGRRTFINRELASVYRVPAPAREGFAEYVYPPDSPRAGFLGQLSFLGLHSHAVASSATKRGLFIRERLLCKRINPPPVNVSTALPEVNPDAQTLRDRLSTHATEPSCAGCHNLTDPIGLGLENFDAMGQYRTIDNGGTIEPAGDLDGAPFADARGVAERVVQHEDFGSCFVSNLYRYATGHEENFTELPILEGLTGELETSGYRLKPAMIGIVMSEGFRSASKAQ